MESAEEYDIWYRHNLQPEPTIFLFNYEVVCSLYSEKEVLDVLNQSSDADAYITHMTVKGQLPRFHKIAPYLRELCLRKLIISEQTTARCAKQIANILVFVLVSFLKLSLLVIYSKSKLKFYLFAGQFQGFLVKRVI